jgi:hypothetical protein
MQEFSNFKILQCVKKSFFFKFFSKFDFFIPEKSKGKVFTNYINYHQKHLAGNRRTHNQNHLVFYRVGKYWSQTNCSCENALKTVKVLFWQCWLKKTVNSLHKMQTVYRQKLYEPEHRTHLLQRVNIWLTLQQTELSHHSLNLFTQYIVVFFSISSASRTLCHNNLKVKYNLKRRESGILRLSLLLFLFRGILKMLGRW